LTGKKQDFWGKGELGVGPGDDWLVKTMEVDFGDLGFFEGFLRLSRRTIQ
jgi:hypothetical protein